MWSIPYGVMSNARAYRALEGQSCDASTVSGTPSIKSPSVRSALSRLIVSYSLYKWRDRLDCFMPILTTPAQFSVTTSTLPEKNGILIFCPGPPPQRVSLTRSRKSHCRRGTRDVAPQQSKLAWTSLPRSLCTPRKSSRQSNLNARWRHHVLDPGGHVHPNVCNPKDTCELRNLSETGSDCKGKQQS